MAAKEPTVERRHRDLALKLLYGGPILSELKWAETGIEPEDSHEGIRRAVRVAQALAAAEQAAAGRAWDEGYSSGRKDEYWDQEYQRAGGDKPSPSVNPYRQPKGPPK